MFPKAFVVRRSLPLKELRATLVEVEHVPTGARIMHIQNDDPENLFCLSLQTWPSSSNGAPHVLEHTVLCGSKKFPVKDPFFSMTRRSLNTFMNAMTGSDFTCYPAASLNRKDFYNLLEVYLDAVFHPLLTEMSFLQEGHHLEFLDPKDSTTPLQIKGIVFNEMKGSLASVDSRLWHALLSALLPDLPYAYNSGGDPREIPQLSYSDLVAFHQTYYHPSRCLFFFYGNFPLEKHLAFLEEKLLSGVQKAEPLPAIPLQKRFRAPVTREESYPSESEQEPLISFGFLTAPVQNQEEVLALSLLDVVLMEDDAALLREALLATKLCSQAEAHMDTEMSEVPYAIVCKGCPLDKMDALEEALFTALRQIAATPISEERIEAALQALEFSRLEIQSESAPFGLTLFFRAALAQQHRCPPEQALLVYSLFASLRKQLKNPAYLPGILHKYFINNPHRVRLVLKADPELTKKEMAEEEKKLQQVRQTLTPAECADIVRKTEALALYQEQTERQSTECLPRIRLTDVAKEARHIPLDERTMGNLKVYHHDCFTNHIAYAHLSFDLPALHAAELPYFHLLLSLLPELGAGDAGYEQILRRIQAHTGGIQAYCALHMHATAPYALRPSVGLRGKALSAHIPHLCALLQDMLLAPRLDDPQRIQHLVKKMQENMQLSLNKRAMRYASHLAASHFSEAGYIHEQWAGLHYFRFLTALVSDLDVAQLIEKLQAIKEKTLTLHGGHLVLSCAASSVEAFAPLGALMPAGQKPAWRSLGTVPPVTSQGRLFSSQVGCTVQALPCVRYDHPDAAALYAAAVLCDHLVLHRKIREQGGAYGTGANYHAVAGFFELHSYRDPHLASTLSTFAEALQCITQGKFSAQELEEAQLELMQQFDAPIPPSQRALTAYSWLRENKSLPLRQALRDHLLGLTPRAVQEAATTHLLPHREKSVIISCGGAPFFERENKKLNTPLPLFSCLEDR